MSPSQHGEEALIRAYLGAQEQGYAADVGAVDGVFLSNTKFLEDGGWIVLCVEPIETYARACRQNRRLVEQVACGVEPRTRAPFYVRALPGGNMTSGSSLAPDSGVMDDPRINGGTSLRDMGAIEFQTTVDVARLDDLLDKHQFPRLDFLSLDTEGTEAEVLRGFTLGRWRPKLVVVESWFDTEPHRAYFEAAGYHRVERLAVNDFYLRGEDAPA